VLFDTPTHFTEKSELGPILGLASCRPIEAGTDSVTIRWVLYQEAVAQFIQAPLMGSGAGLFGERSCLGTGGFPHSTVLQSFSELGMVGGIALVTLFATAVITLFKMIAREKNLAGNTHLLLALAFLAMYLVADQMYGNYFMASGTYFTLGVIAALHDRAKRKSLG
jgi:O-antigen ligase